MVRTKEKALLLWLSQDDRLFIAKSAASIQAATGQRASASSLIRALIANYRQQVNDDPRLLDKAVMQHHR